MNVNVKCELPESIKITDQSGFTATLNIPKIEVVLNLLSAFFFTLPKNVKLDVLIRIRLKKGRSSSWSNKPIAYVTKVATNVWAFVWYNYCSIDGRWVATCRIECSRFESWPGAFYCVLGQDTLLSQCLSPPRCINGCQQLNARGNLRLTGIKSRGEKNTPNDSG